jgi:hypothetical protein
MKSEAEELLQFLHDCADDRGWEVSVSWGRLALIQSEASRHRTPTEALRAFKRDELKKEYAA